MSATSFAVRSFSRQPLTFIVVLSLISCAPKKNVVKQFQREGRTLIMKEAELQLQHEIIAADFAANNPSSDLLVILTDIAEIGEDSVPLQS